MTVVSLSTAPATLPLYAKAALSGLPLVGDLPGVRHTADDVPDLRLTRTAVVTDPGHVADYAAVCGFGVSDTLPATYPHMHAFAMHMALMTDTRFPFGPMGLVHLRNSVAVRRPVRTSDLLDVSVHAENLRPHPKGRLIDIVTRVEVAGELVWDEITTLLARGKGGSEETSPAPLDGAAAPAGPVTWRLGADLGRRYAAVSGDRNPIHLYRITAKALGFPRQIAHGMWTAARCLAALEGRLPEAYAVDVEFRKPILLPSSVTFGAEDRGDDTFFGVTGRAKGDRAAPVHLVGRVTPL